MRLGLFRGGSSIENCSGMVLIENKGKIRLYEKEGDILRR
jgi:hypothetical protein